MKGKHSSKQVFANILDNSETNKSIGNWLNKSIRQGDELRFVSAYFTIEGYEALRKSIDNKQLNFLFGDPTTVGRVDSESDQDKAFKIEDNKLQLQEGTTLVQKWIAKKCIEWVKKDTTQIKTIKQHGFLHGKMYHIHHSDGINEAVSGSSNFTKSGLGLEGRGNLELNLIAKNKVPDELEDWFDKLWDDENKVEDVKERVQEALSKLGNDYSPLFIYYKTLYHFFEERLRSIISNQKMMDKVEFGETAIWGTLHDFQKQGVKGAINRLFEHDGCIIADSVGLGKTYSDLAVIKFFELRNENVLVLCPKRLRDNWTRFTAASGNKHNSLADDRFQYHVLSHTDLNRDSGLVGNIELEDLNWGNYSLVVIDESHNFRNRPTKRRTDEGEENISRYDLLLKKVIKAGVPTKVLMLSATPVNNTFKDLTNQISIISGDKDNYFSKPRLEIPSVRNVMRVAQGKFTEWQKTGIKKRVKEELLNGLSEDFYRLLDGLTIARSRRHIEQFYPEFMKKNGFSKRRKPINLKPPTDSKDDLNYEDMVELIERFKLSIYHPSHYLSSKSDSKSDLNEERSKYHSNNKGREYFLIQMMKVNFLKRLESSVYAFRLTIGRTIKTIDKRLENINKYQHKNNSMLDIETEPNEDEFEDVEDYIESGKVNRYRYSELDLNLWEKDLLEERNVLNEIKEIAAKVDSDRDEKLNKLKEQILNKIKNPPKDKNEIENRKVLIFTTFADTAKYLYDNLLPLAEEQKFNIARIAGSGSVSTNIGKLDYQKILNHFAPRGRECEQPKNEIDVLIATDCISEGQNLQDCDTVINYDIHWNPVRVIQRFGRIDRLNSDNEFLNMINFWPPIELDKYLNLQNRVLTRMELANIAATGRDNLFADSESETQSTSVEEEVQSEMDFRTQQVKDMENEIIDLEQQGNNGFEISDFTLDDFLAELIAYIEKNGKTLEKTPKGLFSVTHRTAIDQSKKKYPAGTIFCLRRKQSPEEKKVDKLASCRLVYVDDTNHAHAIGNTALSNLRALTQNRDKVISKLARKFDMKTMNGENMDDIDKQIISARETLEIQDHKEESISVSSGNDTFKSRASRNINADDYDLISWLVISD